MNSEEFTAICKRLDKIEKALSGLGRIQVLIAGVANQLATPIPETTDDLELMNRLEAEGKSLEEIRLILNKTFGGEE